MSNTHEVIDLEGLDTQATGSDNKGAVEDQGNFKEGYCFKLTSS